jgi:hypothetical protein
VNWPTKHGCPRGEWEGREWQSGEWKENDEESFSFSDGKYKQHMELLKAHTAADDRLLLALLGALLLALLVVVRQVQNFLKMGSISDFHHRRCYFFIMCPVRVFKC